MKKIYFTFLIVIFLFLTFINNSNTTLEKHLEVFSEEMQEKNHYYIAFQNINCSSLNILSYFQDFDIEIEVIYPKNNLVIVDDRINQQLFSFSYSTISNLTKKYLSIIEKYGLSEDVEKVKQYGVLISKVKIIATSNTLNALLEKYPDLQYSYYLDGKYQ